MAGSIGPLLAADEGFNHQIVDTFATVSQTDLAWTEKVCGMAAARDGSLQVAFGFGKYTNRNVFDAYAGVSRGAEQWTVRGSRALLPDADTLAVGPISYEVLQPLHSVRVRLDANDVQPIAYDLLFESEVPCVVEEREDRRTLNQVRFTANQVRYHQIGRASGWVEVDGRRVEMSPQAWISTRDHSWGVRPDVGDPLTDLEPDPTESLVPNVLAVWNPVLFENPDGTTYAYHHYVLDLSGPGFVHRKVQGGFEYADGRRELIADVTPDLHFNTDNSRLLGGVYNIRMTDGSERILELEAISDTGFHLGTGLYLGFDGRHHGSWRGPLHLDGEYFDNCADPKTAERINQFRDCVVLVHDPATGATGWGNCQTFVRGERLG
jgi:hypothetical protein